MIAGIPFVPIEWVGEAIILATTDRKMSSAGAAWLLPDSSPLLRLEKDVVRGGVTISLRTAIGDTGRKGPHPCCKGRTLIHLELQEDPTLESCGIFMGCVLAQHCPCDCTCGRGWFTVPCELPIVNI